MTDAPILVEYSGSYKHRDRTYAWHCYATRTIWQMVHAEAMTEPKFPPRGLRWYPMTEEGHYNRDHPAYYVLIDAHEPNGSTVILSAHIRVKPRLIAILWTFFGLAILAGLAGALLVLT